MTQSPYLGFIISLERGGGLGTALPVVSGAMNGTRDETSVSEAPSCGGIPEGDPLTPMNGNWFTAPEEEVTRTARDGLKPI